MSTATAPPIPVAYRALKPARGTWQARLTGLALFAIGAGVLATAIALQANGTGLGTHTQLGFAPCGFEDRTGLPCATCGMTTSVTLAAHGHLRQAFIVQPAGALFALAMAMCVIVGSWALWTGRSLTPVFATLITPRALIALGLVIAAAWAYRITDALAGHPWTTL